MYSVHICVYIVMHRYFDILYHVAMTHGHEDCSPDLGNESVWLGRCIGQGETAEVQIREAAAPLGLCWLMILFGLYHPID